MIKAPTCTSSDIRNTQRSLTTTHVELQSNNVIQFDERMGDKRYEPFEVPKGETGGREGGVTKDRSKDEREAMAQEAAEAHPFDLDVHLGEREDRRNHHRRFPTRGFGI